MMHAGQIFGAAVEDEAEAVLMLELAEWMEDEEHLCGIG